MPKQRTIPSKSQKVTRIILHKSIFNRNQWKLQSDRFFKGDWQKLPNRNQTVVSIITSSATITRQYNGWHIKPHCKTLLMRLGFNTIPSTNCPVQLSAGCVAFGGVESSHRGPEQPLRPGRRRSTGFINTRLHISDNGMKMRFYLDRFLQHRHSASRLRLSCRQFSLLFLASFFPLVSCRSFGRRFEPNTPTVTNRTQPKNTEEGKGRKPSLQLRHLLVKLMLERDMI